MVGAMSEGGGLSLNTSHQLHGWKPKVERAKRHSEEVFANVNNFLASGPMEVVEEVDTATGDRVSYGTRSSNPVFRSGKVIQTGSGSQASPCMMSVGSKSHDRAIALPDPRCASSRQVAPRQPR